MKYYPGDIVLITGDCPWRGLTITVDVVHLFVLQGMIHRFDSPVAMMITPLLKDVCLLGRPSGFLAAWQRAANDFDRKIGDTITIKRPSMNVIKSESWIES